MAHRAHDELVYKDPGETQGEKREGPYEPLRENDLDFLPIQHVHGGCPEKRKTQPIREPVSPRMAAENAPGRSARKTTMGSRCSAAIWTAAGSSTLSPRAR